MEKRVEPYREGLVLQITAGENAGFVGDVVFVGENEILLVNLESKESYWIDVLLFNYKYGTQNWFKYIETDKTPIDVINDLILYWNREDMDVPWRYQAFVEALQEAKDRIQALERKNH